MPPPVFSSLTRIADFPPGPLHFEPTDPSTWKTGDFVMAEVLPYVGPVDGIELRDGRVCMPMAGDRVVGAFGVRYATLELTGTYEAIGSDGRMDALTEGGCFGATTSRSVFAPAPTPLRYLGHVMGNGRPMHMSDWALPAGAPFTLPVVLLAGTSMSAGKTYAGRVAVRELKRLGHTVVAAKLTGACRRHDTLSFRDAGADFIYDFVDGGLPTSIVPPTEYRDAIRGVLSAMAATGATVAVIEAGASPLEPYNGGTLVDMLQEQLRYVVLAASDPYAVVGIQTAWERSFDVVTGPTANTAAGRALVKELSGLEAVDLLIPDNHSELGARLRSAIGAPRNPSEPAT